MSDAITPVPGQNGALWDSLKRNIKQIKEGRAISILEEAQMAYERKIKNMEYNLRKLKRSVEDTLDMSPDSTTALLLKEFNADAFIEADATYAYDIRNLEIQLNECKKRYNTLFGHTYDVEAI